MRVGHKALKGVDGVDGGVMASDSYWQHTAPTFSLAIDLPRSADVAIIGGGLMGVATSYWLARKGISVVLLERKAIGWGATGRNGGFVVAGPAKSYLEVVNCLGHETAYAVMTDTLINQQLLRQVVEEEALACDFREPGHLRLALTSTEEEQLRTEVAAFQADGFSVDFLNREAVQMLIQTTLAPDVRGGRFKVGQGLIHSARFVRGLAQAAVDRGVHMYLADVQTIASEGESVLLHTSRGQISAASVVVATNAWIGTVVPELFDIIMPRREQMLAYAPVPPLFSPGISACITCGEYFQQLPDGVILIGGCHTVAPGSDIGIHEMVPLPVVQAALETALPRLFPTLAPLLHVTQRWAGLLDYTTDNHPIVDCLPAMPHVFIVCGLSGHGMPFGMRFGQLLAEAVVSGMMPTALRPYRLDRPTLKKWTRA